VEKMRATLTEVYKLLPKKNCGECGVATCMAFASLLIAKETSIDKCPELKGKKKQKLIELLAPPIKAVVIGSGDNTLVIGGKEVMYRHELRYDNPTGIAIDLHDEMSEEEIKAKIRKIEEYSIERIGEKLKIDAIALKSKSNDPLKFGEALLTVMENSKLPLILCSFNPEVLKVGLEMAQDRNPLVYAINESNFSEISELVKKYSLPVVVSSPRNVEKLMKLSGKLMSQGIEDIVLDIGTYPYGKEYAEMLDNLVIIRRLAIEKEVKELGFPILGASSIVWTVKDGIEASFDEACLAASLILRYCDILIMHAFEPLTLLPLLTLRQNIYTDPKKPTSVSPGLYIIGSPDENSPVLITTNFALTYYTVSGDIESGQVSCYLLVADTEGLAVEPALAGGKLNAITVKETIEKSGIENKVKHRKLIIPGVAARIQGEIEDVAKWEVMVGPIDSSRIPNYIRKHWVVE